MIGSASLIGRVSGNMAFRYMDYGLKVRRRERERRDKRERERIEERRVKRWERKEKGWERKEGGYLAIWLSDIWIMD
jgi:hypothetical protein